MYAGLFHSAQRFNSSELANVKFAVRAIVVPTGALAWLLFSPAWIASVASVGRRPLAFIFMLRSLAHPGKVSQAPIWQDPVAPVYAVEPCATAPKCTVASLASPATVYLIVNWP
jgi:hypothetical protein